MIDPLLSLAFSIQSNQGGYALLAGSGVSRSAGIPTGWEIVVDLVRKLAILVGEDCEPDPAVWYSIKFGEEPDYSKLLDALAKTPTERQRLLRSYFEPNEDEKEQGLKAPTAAHRAVAEMVSTGRIRVIVTTNFDRLFEKAIEATGIVPFIISTPDSVEGAMPIVHTDCTIVKVHGDYMDTRLLNTPTELAKYDDRMKKLLDRIFDDFGLLICGWSADWDPALRSAIQRSSARRFTTYWSLRGELKDAARRLANHRNAQEIKIQDADSFLSDLADKVAALEEIGAHHPLSPKLAVSTVKRYIVDDNYKINLHDLVMREAESLFGHINDDHFPVDANLDIDGTMAQVRRYESISEILSAIFAAGGYWGKPTHDYLWTICLARIANPPRASTGLSHLIAMRRYPALLLMYAGGIASISAGNYGALSALLVSTKIANFNKELPAALSLSPYDVFDHQRAQQMFGARRHTPISDHLHEQVREVLREFIPDDSQYEINFDRFEYLQSLVYLDLAEKYDGRFYAPIGRFGWRLEAGHRVDEEFELEAADAGVDWGPLRAGMFDKSKERYSQIKATHDEQLKQARSRYY